ncbi:hypothetical protein [Halovenus salina]|uniref:Halobacterial output domain-containing protein n=1 Tax=Halovenus salina TaxID=1510225 RepID=A0ABD5W6X7_9EURY|nr:hypothetical protein [Halovenus salina]
MTDTAEIPVYDGQSGVETAYARSERQREPFFGIERYDEGYAVTFDLLPAGAALSPSAYETVRADLTDELEAIVADTDLPTEEVSKSVNDSLGNVSLLVTEAGARRVAAVLAPVVLDETNWVEG